MKNNVKRTLLVLSLVAVVMVGSIAGTIAWLTAYTNPVTNTFTVGNITIELAETTGTDYKVVPGVTDAKDPKVTVKSGSEKCYVYVLVENNLVIDGTVVATVDIPSTWDTVATSGNKTLYVHNAVVDAASADVELPVFNQVTYADEEITELNIASLAGKTIVVDAYAHQSANVDQDDANSAAKAHFGF
nr:hypothetical protein [Clostridia bacterium]